MRGVGEGKKRGKTGDDVRGGDFGEFIGGFLTKILVDVVETGEKLINIRLRGFGYGFVASEDVRARQRMSRRSKGGWTREGGGERNEEKDLILMHCRSPKEGIGLR